MSSLGDRGQFELISQLRGFLRDKTTRRPATAVVERVGLTAVTVRLSQTGTRLVGVPVINGVGQLVEGQTVYLLYLPDNHVVALKTAYTPAAVATQVGLPFHRHVSPSASESSSRSPSSSASASLSPSRSLSASPSGSTSHSASRSVSASASPSSAPGPAPILDLQADLGVTQSGGLVTVWADQSGNGNDFTASGYGPTLGTSGGLATVSFNPGGTYGQHMLGPMGFGQNLDSFTVFTIAYADHSNGGHFVIGTFDTDDTFLGWFVQRGQTDALSVDAAASDGSASSHDALWDVYASIIGELTDRSTLYQQRNSTPVNTSDPSDYFLDSPPIGDYTGAQCYLCSLSSTPPFMGASATIDVRCVVMYAPALGSTDRDAVLAALRTKWGLP